MAGWIGGILLEDVHNYHESYIKHCYVDLPEGRVHRNQIEIV